MKILMIESSPHRQGSSNLLAEHFMRGAREAGHEIEIFDAGHANIRPCLGCEDCGMAAPCCQKDDMAALREKILGAQMAVFVTPLYYFGMSAQLKAVIDRFYSFNGQLSAKGLKTALIVAAWDDRDWTMRDINAHYETLCRYLNFQSQGTVLAGGCGTASMTKNSPHVQRAYQFGRSL